VFTPQALTAAHVLDAFDCGNDELNTWLRTSALRARRSNTASTFVWCEEGRCHVAAYYSFTAMTVAKEELPDRLGRGGLSRVPAVLLARLALDRRYHGQGIGTALLVDAFHTALAGNAVFAVRFFVVDAIDESAFRFYQKHGFQGIPGTMRLFRKMSDIAETVRQ
jgi:GNAT superfamily N-acetyltransferase